MIKVFGLHANNTLSQVVETRPSCRYQVFDNESIITDFFLISSWDDKEQVMDSFEFHYYDINEVQGLQSQQS